MIVAMSQEAELLQQIVEYLLGLGLPAITVQRFESELLTTNRSLDELRQVFETLRRAEP